MRVIDPIGKETAILAASVQEFAAKGFHGASVGDIAKVANVSVGTLYRIFDSKEGLANKTYQQCLGHYDQYRTDHLDREVAPRRQFTAIIEPIVSHFQNFPESYIFCEIQFHGSFIDAVSLAKKEELYQRMLNWAKIMKQNGVLKDLPDDLIISSVRGAFTDLIKAALEGKKKITNKKFKELEQLCWEAISLS